MIFPEYVLAQNAQKCLMSLFIFFSMAAGKRTHNWKMTESDGKGYLFSFAHRQNSNGYTHSNGNNIYVARCRRHTKNRYGG